MSWGFDNNFNRLGRTKIAAEPAKEYPVSPVEADALIERIKAEQDKD